MVGFGQPLPFHSSYYEKSLATGDVRCIDDEIPFDIPDTWEWTRLGYIFLHNTGKALKGNGGAGNPYKYLTTSNVYWDRFDFTSVKSMNFSDAELDKCTVTKGDLLVCEGGDVGRSAIWYYDYDICIQNHVHRLRSYLNLETRYFYYVLRLYKSMHFLGGKGIGIQGLSSGALHSVLTPLPPLSEQERIARRLDYLEKWIVDYFIVYNEIETLNGDIATLLQKSILQYAIQGKLVPQLDTDDTADELLESIKLEKRNLVAEGKLKKSALTDSVIYRDDDNKYYERIDGETTDITDVLPFDIPDNWTWVSVGTIVEIMTGASFKKEQALHNGNGIRVLRGGNISPNSYSFKDDDIFISKDLVSDKIILKANDLITPAVTSIDNVGKTARVAENYTDTTVGGFVFIIRPYYNDTDFAEYLCAAIQSPVITNAIKGITKKSGSAFYNIGKERLCRIFLPLPPLPEIRRINSAIKRILTCTEVN